MNQVALKKFYALLKKVKDKKWIVTKRGLIRCRCRCPLVVATDIPVYLCAAYALGFSSRESAIIVNAADFFDRDEDPEAPMRHKIRRQMLKILGLKEPA